MRSCILSISVICFGPQESTLPPTGNNFELFFLCAVVVGLASVGLCNHQYSPTVFVVALPSRLWDPESCIRTHTKSTHTHTSLLIWSYLSANVSECMRFSLVWSEQEIHGSITVFKSIVMCVVVSYIHWCYYHVHSGFFSVRNFFWRGFFGICKWGGRYDKTGKWWNKLQLKLKYS